jgi:hypothetical protein
MPVTTIDAKVLSSNKSSQSGLLVKEDKYTNMGQKDYIIHEAMKLVSLNGYLNTGIIDIIKSSNSSNGGGSIIILIPKKIFFMWSLKKPKEFGVKKPWTN